MPRTVCNGASTRDAHTNSYVCTFHLLQLIWKPENYDKYLNREGDYVEK